MLSRDFIALLDRKVKEVKCERGHAGRVPYFGTFFGTGAHGGHIYFSTLYLRTAPGATIAAGRFGSGRLAVIDRVEPVISV